MRTHGGKPPHAESGGEPHAVQEVVTLECRWLATAFRQSACRRRHRTSHPLDQAPALVQPIKRTPGGKPPAAESGGEPHAVQEV